MLTASNHQHYCEGRHTTLDPELTSRNKLMFARARDGMRARIGLRRKKTDPPWQVGGQTGYHRMTWMRTLTFRFFQDLSAV